MSDAFEGSSVGKGSSKENKDEPLMLELVVDVYNINTGHNSAIQEACSSLKGYSEFVRRTRENQRAMPFSQAVDKAVDECIHDGILADFLRDNKAEVIGVSIFEFDRKEYEKTILAQEREESEARGIAKGRVEGAYDKAVSTAKSLLAMGLLSLEQIAEATKLPLSEVAAL